MLKISIVTASYNQAKFIEECLESVKQQNYPAWEHIVIDGASHDETVPILESHSSRPGWQHLRWISEPDKGQSNALNKGFALASGNIIGWLNSDDIYLPGCLQKVASFFQANPQIDILYGDYFWIDEDGKALQLRQEIEFSRFILLYSRVCFVHSSGALFLNRRIFDRGSYLDEQLHYAMDCEFYLRLASQGYCFRHLNEILGAFRWQRECKTMSHPEKQKEELAKVRRKYAPALSAVEPRTLRGIVLLALMSAATLFRWSEKALRGHYFKQFGPFSRDLLGKDYRIGVAAEHGRMDGRGAMEWESLIQGEIEESIEAKAALAREAAEPIAEAAAQIVERLRAGNKLIVFGNGGSAADAQHIAAELVGRYRAERRALPAIALTTNTSVLTAVGNDYGFDSVFDRQLQALGRPGDVALAISTSGNSPNVLRAVERAKQMGIHTIGLTGKTGGKLRTSVELCLCVPSDATPRIQEAHMLIGHILSEIIEQAFLGQTGSISQELVAAATRP